MIKLKNILREIISSSDIVYHGSAQDFDNFDENKSNFRGTIYFTTNKDFAVSFAKDRGGVPVIYHCKLKVNKIFDFEKEDLNLLRPILKELIQSKYKDKITGVSFMIPISIHLDGKEIEKPTLDQAVDWYIWRIKHGSWRILEGEKILNFIKDMGYDALVTAERGTKNIAVFDPKKIEIVKKERL